MPDILTDADMADATPVLTDADMTDATPVVAETPPVLTDADMVDAKPVMASASPQPDVLTDADMFDAAPVEQSSAPLAPLAPAVGAQPAAPMQKIGAGERIRLSRKAETGRDASTLEAIGSQLTLGAQPVVDVINKSALQQLASGKKKTFFRGDVPFSELPDYEISNMAKMANLDMPFMDSPLKQWDKTKGAAITDPKARRAERAKFIQTEATNELKRRLQGKMEAGEKLSKSDQTLWARLAGGAVDNTGYTGAFMRGPVGAVLGPVARRYGDLQTDEQTLVDGKIETTEKGDTQGTAMAKGAAGGSAEYAIEKFGTEAANFILGNTLKRIPGLGPALSKAGGTSAGKVIANVAQKFKKLGEVTGKQNLAGEIFAEELPQQLVDVGLGLDKRESAKLMGIGSDTAEAFKSFVKPENIGNMALEMLLMQAAQGTAASVSYYDAYSKDRNRLDGTLLGFGADPDLLKKASVEEKRGVLKALSDKLTPDKSAAILDKLGKRAGDLHDNIVKQEGYDFDANQYGITSRFALPAEGEEDAWGTLDDGSKLYESTDSGIGLVARPDGTATLYGRDGTMEDYKSVAEAADAANKLSVRDQVNDVRRGQKAKFVESTARRLAPDVNVRVHNTTEDLLEAVPAVKDSPDFEDNPSGIAIGDTIHVVLDNIETPRGVVSTILHEAGVHAGLGRVLKGEAKKQFLGNLGSDAVKKYEEATSKMGYMQGAGNTEEALAYMYEQRLANPTGFQRGISWLHNQLRKVNPNYNFTDSDIEVMLADAQRSVRNAQRGAVTQPAAPVQGKARETAEMNAYERKALELEESYPKPAPAPAKAGTLETVQTVQTQAPKLDLNAESQKRMNEDPQAWIESLRATKGDIGKAVSVYDSLREESSPAEANAQPELPVQQPVGDKTTPAAADVQQPAQEAAQSTTTESATSVPVAEQKPMEAGPYVPRVASNEAEAEQTTSLTGVGGKQYPTVEIPLDELSLSKDVPQFKENADSATGEVEPIEGQKYERVGTAPIVVWERTDGRKEIITGRHRAAFARRVGEKSIPAQVVREVDGFTKSDAITFDAESNIRDGQGSVKDYANYFRNTNTDLQEASSRGLLGRDKGRKGFSIGKYASDDLYSVYRDGKINDSKAAAISESAPNNPGVQQVGIRYAEKHNAEETRQYMRSLQSMRPPEQSGQQLDLLGFDTSWQETADNRASAAVRITSRMNEELSALKAAKSLSAEKRNEIVKKYGVKAGNEKAIAKRIEDLTLQVERFKNWHLNPDLVKMVAEEAGEKASEESAVPVVNTPPADTKNNGSLFDEKALPFNLEGGTQKDVVRIAEEKKAEENRQAEAKRKLDAAPVLPGIDSHVAVTEKPVGETQKPLPSTSETQTIPRGTKAVATLPNGTLVSGQVKGVAKDGKVEFRAFKLRKFGSKAFTPYPVNSDGTPGFKDSFVDADKVRPIDAAADVTKLSPEEQRKLKMAERIDAANADIELRKGNEVAPSDVVDRFNSAKERKERRKTDNGDVKFRRASVSDEPVFFSQLRRTLEAKMPNRMTVMALRGMIDPAKGSGVKADEIEWTGLKDFLDGKNPGDYVTKAEVLEAAKDVEIQEVVKVQTQAELESQEELTVLARLGRDRTREQDARYEQLARRSRIGKDLDNATKFEQYQLPGGKNYRELLLTLPGKREVSNADFEAWLEKNHPDRGDFVVDQSALMNAYMRETGNTVEPNVFRSSHFSEPNILAHVRFNERTAANGDKTLFLEEVQSDWHQAGREKGYGDPRAKLIAKIRSEATGTLPDNTEDWAIVRLSRAGVTPLTVAEWANYGAEKQGVPDAPFKDTSKGWARLAFKRMLRWAAENDFDRIAWTTGEQQAERYNLSKKIERVSYNDLTGQLMAWEVGAYRDPGRLPVLRETVPIEKSADYIGKEAAQKLIASAPINDVRSISGDDLRVGGEGMRTFYDQILPSIANDIGKKFGARVEVAQVETEPVSYSLMSIAANRYLQREFTRSEMEEAVAERPDAFKVIEHPAKTVAVHSLPVTPAMRDSVMGGQPMFRRSGVELDAAYMRAVEEGDRGGDNLVELLRKTAKDERDKAFAAWRERNPETAERLKRMVDERLTSTGYNVEPVYRGDKTKGVNRINGNRDGFGWFTENPAYAKATAGGGDFRTFRLRAVNMLDLTEDDGNPFVYDWADTFKHPDHDPSTMGKAVYDGELFTLGGWQAQDSLLRFAKARGYDAVRFNINEDNGIDVVTFDPKQAKLADPVTYDDAGNVIPLSERFNDESSDIRFRRSDASVDKLMEEVNRQAVADNFRALPSTDPKAREIQADVQVSYAYNLTRKTVQRMQDEARGVYEKNKTQAQIDLLAGKTDSGDVNTDARRMAQDKMAVDDLTMDAVANPDDDNKTATAMLGIWRWYERGTDVARALRLRFDPVDTPEGRRAWILRTMLAPTRKEAAIIKRAKTTAEAIERLKIRAKNARKVMVSLKAKNIDISKLTAAELMDDAFVAKIMQEISTARSGWGDVVHEWWRNAILSAPTTQIVNMVGNAGHAALEAFMQRPVEALINTVAKNDRAASLRSVGAMYRAIIPSLNSANKAFLQSWKTEKPVSGDSAKVEESNAAIPTKFGGKIIRTPQRIMMAVDEWFKTVFMAMLTADYATREFDRLVKEGKQNESNREDYVLAQVDKDSASYAKAWEETLRWSFQQKPGHMAGAIMNWRNDPTFGFLLKFIFPFVKTPANIISTGIRKTPLNAPFYIYKAATGKYSKEDAFRLGAEQAVGMVFMSVLYGMMEGDDDDPLNRPRITGSKKTTYFSPAGEKEAEAQDYPPMSVRVGDKWVSYARLEPFATMVSTMVDALTAWKQAKDGKTADIPATLFASIRGNFSDKTFLQGVGNMVNIIEGDEFAISKAATSTLAGFNPNIIRSTVRAFDPYVRDTKANKGFVKKLSYQIMPSEGNAPLPKIDKAGQPVKKEGGGVYNSLVPFRVQSADKTTKIDAMVKRYNESVPKDDRWWPSTPSPITVRLGKEKIELTPEEFETYKRYAGDIAQRRLKSVSFNFDAPTESDMERLKKVYEKARDIAKDKIRPSVIRRFTKSARD